MTDTAAPRTEFGGTHDCDTCGATFRTNIRLRQHQATFEPHLPPRAAGRVGDATLEARMAAQEAGWATRRNHSGQDLCTGCQ